MIMDKIIFCLFLILALVSFYKSGELKTINEKKSRMFLILGILLIILLLSTTVIKFFVFKS